MSAASSGGSVSGCRCRMCRPEPEDDPGPPITAAQRAYADEFVAWFRASDIERPLHDARLARLFTLVSTEARRRAA